MSKENFKIAYSLLNEEQRKAVDAIEGPVIVIAGPGTGKTQIIATRIANIIYSTDTDPSAILALTFTESGSTAMRNRLVSLIGPDAYKVRISTFHGFAKSLIDDHPEFFLHAGESKTITDIEKYQILESILDETQFQKLRPLNAPYFYIKSIISSIQQLKREAISPEAFQDVIKSGQKNYENNKESLTKAESEKTKTNLEKYKDLLHVYARYQEELTKNGLYDFDDMIIWLINAFKQNGELLSIYQEKFQYFLVDEYQDTNNAQNEIVDLLCSYWGDKANIFVVGDDEQSIYRFQGASLENIINFQSKYPTTLIITLKYNYRSQQNILDAARSVIKHNQFSLSNQLNNLNRNLVSQAPHSLKPVRIVNTNHELSQYTFLINEIKELLSDGVLGNQIAIIAKNNAELVELSTILDKNSISNTIQGGGNVLDKLVLRYFLKTLQVINMFREGIDDENLFTFLNYDFLALPQEDILKLARFASQKRTSISLILLNHKLNDIVSDSKPFTILVDKISNLSQKEANLSLKDYLVEVLENIGLKKWILDSPTQSEYLFHLDTFLRFTDSLLERNQSLNLISLLSYLNTMKSYGINIPLPETTYSENYVVLTTAHKSKGLEWEYVYLYNTLNTKWGNTRNYDKITLPESLLKNPNLHDPNEEERRLFYVAMTRAKKELSLIYPQFQNSGGNSKETTPSLFVMEIDPSTSETISPEVPQEQIDSLLITVLGNKTEAKNEDDFLDGLISQFKLSPSSLNDFLECKYKFKLNHLVKVPRKEEPVLIFGSAIHKALEKFYLHQKQSGEFPTEDLLHQVFTDFLSSSNLSSIEKENRLREGKLILTAYYQLNKDNFKSALYVEKFFGNFNNVQIDNFPLSGKIDRIEQIEPNSKVVKVVDYKSGSRKTRGEIEGTTQNSNGNYKRQLVFYKLLADLDQSFSYNVQSCELDFVEAPKRENKTGKEVFKITKEEVDELKSVIKKVILEIKNKNFQRTTDYAICHNCIYKDHCYPGGVPDQVFFQQALI